MLKNLICSLILLYPAFIPLNVAHRLTINVAGLKSLKGELYVSLHNRAEYFQVADSALMKRKIPVNRETETVAFKNLPEGTYAIAVFHDENLNGMLDVNEKGIPLEGYGFSVRSKFLGRPKFEQAAFDLSRSDTIEIKMVYPLVKEK